MTWKLSQVLSQKAFKMFGFSINFTGNIISECEKTEETLMTSWYPAVTAVFNDKNINKGLKVS